MSDTWDGIGTSMLPSIPPGSRLDLEPVSGRPGTARVGDVVVYLDTDGDFVAHRVIAIEDDPGGRVLVTRGDNQDRSERVPASAVAFKVLRVARGPLSYSTTGPAGRLVARLALEGGPTWRVLRKLSKVLLAAVSGPHFPHGGAAKER
jgi:hypothetical protein